MIRDESNVEDLLSEALLITDNINHAIIEIEHTDGIITLKGIVESKEDKSAAESLARQQEGVIDVINNLRTLAR